MQAEYKKDIAVACNLFTEMLIADG